MKKEKEKNYRYPFYDQIVNSSTAAIRSVYEHFDRADEAPTEETVAGWITLSSDPRADVTLPMYRVAKHLGQPPATVSGLAVDDLKRQEQAREPTEQHCTYNFEGGYVNRLFKPDHFAQELLPDILSSSSYGSDTEGQGRNVVIDFSSPNIAKPFGVGHLRSTVIGNALYHIFEKLGYNSIGINHLGDWGTQFGKMIVAFKHWGSDEMLKDDPVRALFNLYTKFHREAKENPELDDEARAEFKRLEEGEEEATRLWKRFKDYSLEEFNRIYDILGIRFDYNTGESFYNDKIDSTISLLEEKNLPEISQEALIVNLEKYDLGACLLKKGDDATLYATRDLAGILYRHDEFDFAKCLYVVGASQALHFKQVFKVIELAGYDFSDGLVHVPFGWIRFEEKAMSTREGNIIFLDDVISQAKEIARKIIIEKNPDIEDVDKTAEQIGVGAVVFAQTSVRRMKDIDFRWEDALSFEGETGPYLQYTHARLCSLARKYDRQLPDTIGYDLFVEPEEKNVLLTLSRYPDKISQAASEYEPFVISAYLIDLAQEFNTFYQKHRIITDDEPLTAARMCLSEAVRIVIADGLAILGIAALERM